MKIFSNSILPFIYRMTMALTKRRGAHTLARINAFICPNGNRIRLQDGSDFFLPPDPHFFGYLIGHENHVAKGISMLAKPGDTIIDVGANIGYFAAQMARQVGPNGRVFAYEADAQNMALLVENAKISAESGCFIEPIHAAISDTEATLSLSLGDQSTLHKVTKKIQTGPTVKAVSLSTEFDRLNISEARLVKIDVEGHENYVLRGMDKIVRQNRVEALIVEIVNNENAIKIYNELINWNSNISELFNLRSGNKLSTLDEITEIDAHTDIMILFQEANPEPDPFALESNK